MITSSSEPAQSPHSPHCIFTICTKSYIGLAEALGTSMRDNGVNADFLIIVVDHNVSDVQSISGQIISAKAFCGYSNESWTSRTFKYDLVELCTSIKARAFQTIFELGYKKAIYFDPDIIVFNDLGNIFGALDTHDFVATPHRLSIESDMPARGGVFNLGFLAARNGGPAEKVMTWWDARLEHYSINDPLRGYFTDQKWMDHLPILLRNDRLLISDHPGMNLAPWNLTEREMRTEGTTWKVRLKEEGAPWNSLCFVHFSAFNYRSMVNGKSTPADADANDKMPGFLALLNVLTDHLKRGGFLNHASKPYEYGCFSNGAPVLPGHRRIYHRSLDAGYALGIPFSEKSEFYASLKRAGLLVPTNHSQITGLDLQVRNRKIGRVAKLLDLAARCMIFLLGYHRYSLLSKFLVRYFHQVNHVRLLREKEIDVEYF